MAARNSKKTDEQWQIFRNLLFNELGVTKEIIREWVKQAVTEVATKHVENNSCLIDDQIREHISEKVMDRYDKDAIKREVADRLYKELSVVARAVQPIEMELVQSELSVAEKACIKVYEYYNCDVLVTVSPVQDVWREGKRLYDERGKG